MRFEYVFKKSEPQQIKYFLKEQGISKGLLAKIKFQGGQILVNDHIENVLYFLQEHDIVTVVIPDEKEHETLLADDTPLDIVFEDEHLLIVNKPSNVSSIPAQYHPNQTMANRVKGYYKQKGYRNQVVHVVTRLDRDTTGLMLFAKHGFAHAKLDVQLREKTLNKHYQALVCGDLARLKEHEQIIAPIGRDMRSILKREVREDGQYAFTEYWCQQQTSSCALVDIKLHTGRTHQIRVHFESIGCPLVGDDMYGGRMDLSVKRQALHCYHLAFTHPFTHEPLSFYQTLPEDMNTLIQATF
ncbi:RluA family pseudouridine synthase [uncultured Enterococcus sp.]|uniref:RluA family pseudouridine synthase n=1 Tax=uncultured Enterococcus sp. TaxID=167972 RepID=UPI0025F051FE|nr:RluA family pseudouridine synthase [uncultured Enterococcus sp.]